MLSVLLLSALPVLSSGWTFVDAPPGDLPVPVHVLGGRLVALEAGLPRVSDDDGRTWRASSRGLPTNAYCATGDEEDGVLVAYCSGRFFRSTDSGNSWSDWSEGFTTDMDISPYYGLALGDSSAVFLAGVQDDSRLWVRHGNGPWRRGKRLEQAGTDLLWTGGAFLLYGDYRMGGYTLLRSEDGLSWESQPLGGYLQSLAARGDTTWILAQDTLRTSLDHGATWLPGKPGPKDRFVVSGRGAYGLTGDSVVSIDPVTGKTRPLGIAPGRWLQGAYSGAALEILNFWSGPSLVSRDSGRTWTSEFRPEAGLYSTTIAQHDGSWYSDGSRFWSRKAPGAWAHADTLWATSFHEHEGILHAMGYHLWTLSAGSWVRDSVPRPTDTYSEGRLRWIEGLDVPAMTNGDHVWLRSPDAATWRRLEKEVLLGANGNTAVGFASRLWFAVHTFREYLDDCLFAFDTATGTLTPFEIPHYEGAYRIAVSGTTLWVATDVGLFRSDDTGKTFQEAGLPQPWSDFAASDLLVRGDTIVATLQSMAMRVADCPERATWLSFDNGGGWIRDPDTAMVADAFFSDSSGLYGFVLGRGIHRWQASGSTGSPIPRSPAPRTFALRRSGGAWFLVGTPGEAIEIRDTLGKLISTATLDSRGLSDPLDLPSGINLLVPASPTGGRPLSIMVP